MGVVVAEVDLVAKVVAEESLVGVAENEEEDLEVA